LLGVSLDITDRKQAQDYLAQQERLAAVGQMAAGIAHDFNNILAVIMLYSQVLQLSVEKPEDRRRIETIREQAQSAANLVQQILDFSRRSSMSRVSLSLVPFVKELIHILRRTLPESIRIEFTGPDQPLMLQVDPARLQQALMNLAINARDAMPQGGTLSIHLGDHRFVGQEDLPLPRMAPGHWVRLSVIDTGTGIAPEVLPYIFDPFFTTKKPGSGTGLGLAQVHGIIRQFGGQIDVSSEVGVGTEFSIFLPLAEEEKVEQATGETSTPGGSGETILLVEDEAALRGAVEEMLRELGYEVLIAGDGREALGVFAQHRDQIDLLLSDMVMPEMSGLALVREIVKERPDIKVIFATGYAPMSADELANEGLHVAWLHKPFSIDELATSVRNQLVRNQLQ
jgi:nitrogen-specific signal transduction histidine kinase/ActR/RegA family two-component response regulator